MPTEELRPISPSWAEQIPDAEWAVYREVLEAARQRDLRFALGGGFAFSVYANRWRDTKDLDLYILPADRERMLGVLADLGFTDYYDTQHYDRHWIYRGYKQGLITDLIWAMANHRCEVDATWLERARSIELHGLEVDVLAPEELVWTKLYVLQRDRCDWPDILNLVYAQGPALDWTHLLKRLGEDTGLLTGILSVFRWMCPMQARSLPKWLWPRVGLSAPNGELDCGHDDRRVKLIDMRDWFGPRAAGV